MIYHMAYKRAAGNDWLHGERRIFGPFSGARYGGSAGLGS